MSATRHFLVVDDDARVRSSLKLMLGALGCSCDLVSSGEEALREVDAKRYDGLLLDLHLGAGLQPTEMLGAIAEKSPALLQRTILSTGDPGNPLVAELARRFPVAVLPKPFSVQSLREIIERISPQSDGNGSAPV
jgi:DNA-binding NtrC family response regulator